MTTETPARSFRRTDEDESNFFLECTAPLPTNEDETDEETIIGAIAMLDEIAASSEGEDEIIAWRNRRAQLLVELALYRIAKFKTQESKGYRRF